MAFPEPLTPMAFEQITVSSTAVGFTAATAQISATAGVRGADYAVVTVETNAVRYRDDGLAPTATVGMPAAVAQVLTVSGIQSMRNIKFIRQSADATISVAYYRYGGA